MNCAPISSEHRLSIGEERPPTTFHSNSVLIIELFFFFLIKSATNRRSVLSFRSKNYLFNAQEMSRRITFYGVLFGLYVLHNSARVHYTR